MASFSENLKFLQVFEIYKCKSPTPPRELQNPFTGKKSEFNTDCFSALDGIMMESLALYRDAYINEVIAIGRYLKK